MRTSRAYYIYILTNRAHGTLYTGVTNSIERRLFEHASRASKGFTSKYGLARLVYVEQTESIETAIAREKQLKGGRRQWKINLIEASNPHWQDLGQFYGMDPETSSG